MKSINRIRRSGCSMLIAALIGSLPLMMPLAAAQQPEQRGAAGPLRQDSAPVPPKWHDDSGLKLRPEQFEAYGAAGPEWRSEPEERGAAGPLREEPHWRDDSGLKLRGAQFEDYGLTGWEFD